MNDTVKRTIEERGKVYGDPKQSHTNIGLSWAALIQQHYGIVLDHPLPASLVAQMMVTFKMQRAARVFHEDNYIDATAYTDFACAFQRPPSEPPVKPVSPQDDAWIQANPPRIPCGVSR